MTPVGAAGIGSVVLALTLAASPADEDGMRVHRWFGPVLRSAIAGAAVRLADPDCAGLLASFRDGEGRLLRENLERDDAAAYVRRIFFYDGSDYPLCRVRDVYAFTRPGSHVVRACPALGWLATTNAPRAQAVVIHEMLHTLGLGENPPSSAQITSAVEARCTPAR